MKSARTSVDTHRNAVLLLDIKPHPSLMSGLGQGKIQLSTITIALLRRLKYKWISPYCETNNKRRIEEVQDVSRTRCVDRET